MWAAVRLWACRPACDRRLHCETRTGSANRPLYANADHSTAQPPDATSIKTEDLGLPRLELLVGQDALLMELRQLLELIYLVGGITATGGLFLDVVCGSALLLNPELVHGVLEFLVAHLLR